MTHPSKTKGNGFERELVNDAKSNGIKAKRAYASNGQSLGMHEEVDCLIGGKRVQAKRRKALPKYLKPSSEVDACVFRENNGRSLVLIEWSEYLSLLKGDSDGES